MSSPRHRPVVATLLLTIVILAVVSLKGGTELVVPTPLLPSNARSTVEIVPQMLALPPPLDRAEAELSGMAWYNRWLLLLPQYPDFAGEAALYAIPRDALEVAIADPRAEPLQARTVPLRGMAAINEMPGYEGFEAIAVSGQSIIMLVELRGRPMRTLLVRARIADDMSEVVIAAIGRETVQAPTRLRNLAYETVVADSRGSFLSLYEANGVEPAGFQFTAALTPITPLTAPDVAYRITDATALDAQGRFWISNYFFPGEKVLTNPDARGGGVTHYRYAHVERLIQMQWTPRAVVRTATPPLYLRLAETPRNWEGVVRFDRDAQCGFLLVTDRHPTSLLAYVAAPSP